MKYGTIRGEPKIRGDIIHVGRRPLGLYSIDRALGFQGNWGLPGRSVIEIYGNEEVGKTTFILYAGARWDVDGSIHYADIEGKLDRGYTKEVLANAGFNGEFYVPEHGDKKRKTGVNPHERQLQEVLDKFPKGKATVGVLDSIGSFFTTPEEKKPLDERTVGQRAKVINNAARQLMARLRVADDPKLFFLINHKHDKIGGTMSGVFTPGGKTKNFACNVRLWMYRVDSKFDSWPGSFLAEMRVVKLTHGGADPSRKGLVFIIPGYGVSQEMTAVFDCVTLGLAKRGAKLSLNGENVAQIGELIEMAQEPWNHIEVFQPFFDALEEHEEA